MLPTISAEGELVLDNKLVCRLFPERLGRGDIVTFVSPVDPQRVVCKRILGLPGDTICVDPTGEKAPSTEHVIVPAGHFWLGGDNSAWSRDSRDYGPVPIALMKGRLVAKVRTIFLSTLLSYELLKPDLALAKRCGIPEPIHLHFLNPVIRADFQFNFR
jgi:mitochondrial inner membrane protease subunit 1